MEPLSSFITTPAIRQRVDQWARQEHQNPHQVASVAIEFFLDLPDSVKLALLRGLDGVPAEQIYPWAMQELLRVMTHRTFEVATQQLAETMDVSQLGSLETEDDILNAALKVTHQNP